MKQFKDNLHSNYFVANHLDDHQKDQLLQLYRNEWWSQERTKEDVERILKNSSFIIAIVDIHNDKLVAFSRILTDYFNYSYVYDVIVESSSRAEGIGKLLLNTIINHPILNEIGCIELVCRKEMINFYQQFGFTQDYGLSISMRRQSCKKTAVLQMDRKN